MSAAAGARNWTSASSKIQRDASELAFSGMTATIDGPRQVLYSDKEDCIKAQKLTKTGERVNDIVMATVLRVIAVRL